MLAEERFLLSECFEKIEKGRKRKFPEIVSKRKYAHGCEFVWPEISFFLLLADLKKEIMLAKKDSF
jgi:hypothetical protein